MDRYELSSFNELIVFWPAKLQKSRSDSAKESDQKFNHMMKQLKMNVEISAKSHFLNLIVFALLDNDILTKVWIS